MLYVGCSYAVRSTWLADVPFEQGTVELFLGQIKLYFGGTYPHTGSLSVKLNSPEKITDVKLLTSDIKLRFFKKGTIVKEMGIFIVAFEVDKDNIISGAISTHDRYTHISPKIDKKYSLNWDEFMQAAKESDKIECSILLRFEANGQLYSIQKVGELKKDIKGLFWAYE